MITDKVLRDLQRIPGDFKNPDWIRGAVHSALLFNFGVSERSDQSKHMVYLLELIFHQYRYDVNLATAREAIHAGVIAMHLRGHDSLTQPKSPLLTVADLREIVEAGDNQVHDLTRLLAHNFLEQLNLPSDKDLQYVQVLSEPVVSGDFMRFNVLNKALPLRALPDLESLESQLLQEFPWLHRITETVVQELRMAAHLGMNTARLRPLLLAGPPGTGKSRFARRLAELMELPTMTIACAGASDSMSVRGTSKGWSSSRPGVILGLLQGHKCAQGVVLWDELEKASPSARNGRIWDTCLQLLEEETAHRYFDECLEIHCNLSWVSHVGTVNSLTPLPRPLIERFQVMLAPQPGPEHFDALLNGVLDDLAHGYQLVDRRLLPALDSSEYHILKTACELNPRLLARALHRLLADKISAETPALH